MYVPPWGRGIVVVDRKCVKTSPGPAQAGTCCRRPCSWASKPAEEPPSCRAPGWRRWGKRREKTKTGYQCSATVRFASFRFALLCFASAGAVTVQQFSSLLLSGGGRGKRLLDNTTVQDPAVHKPEPQNPTTAARKKQVPGSCHLP